eukprot:GFYU01000135.1.p1 GENE.GFYU01000135.1~~GFYU01000135.1.p1  ORF type:complete len:251 (-),score=47.13 GFYU01000135.1:424-1176(-)
MATEAHIREGAPLSGAYSYPTACTMPLAGSCFIKTLHKAMMGNCDTKPCLKMKKQILQTLFMSRCSQSRGSAALPTESGAADDTAVNGTASTSPVPTRSASKSDVDQRPMYAARGSITTPVKRSGSTGQSYPIDCPDLTTPGEGKIHIRIQLSKLKKTHPYAQQKVAFANYDGYFTDFYVDPQVQVRQILLALHKHTCIPVDKCKLYYCATELCQNSSAQACKLKDGSLVRLVLNKDRSGKCGGASFNTL